MAAIVDAGPQHGTRWERKFSAWSVVPLAFELDLDQHWIRLSAPAGEMIRDLSIRLTVTYGTSRMRDINAASPLDPMLASSPAWGYREEINAECQKVISRFMQAPIRLSVDRFHERLQLSKDLFRSVDALDAAKTREQSRDLSSFGGRHPGGILASLLTLSSRNMVLEWFEQRRGMALAFIGIAVAFGFSLTPPFFEWLIQKGGWSRAWQWIGNGLL